jgi:tetratricopeptide (TPR) repeat protein
VLEGSVQRGGNRLRVNVQLIDTGNGSHLWAERFDKPIADLLDMQDEIVSRLANTLDTQLIAAEARRAERSPNPDAMDLYFQGVARANMGVTPDYMAQARVFFEKAIALDPGSIDALVGIANVDATTAAAQLTDDRTSRFSAAEATLNKVVSMVPQHAFAHALLGFVQILTNRAAQGIAECRQALTLNRNLTNAHAWIGLGKIYCGRSEETEAHIHEALRLSPRDDHAFRWMMFVGIAKVYLRADDEAVVWLRRSIEANRNQPMTHFQLAAALAQLGGWTRRVSSRRQDLLSIRASPSVGTGSTSRPTIRPTSPDASASMRACVWPGCRRGERAGGECARAASGLLNVAPCRFSKPNADSV